MSFQAYLDTIKAKTGKTPDDFKKIAEQKGLLKPGVKAGEIIAWLKKDFGLGHGQAMAIYAVFSAKQDSKIPKEDAIAKHFTGRKSSWRPVFDTLIDKLKESGEIKISTTDTYLSLLKGGKKFAIVQMTGDRMDIGIKRKGIDATGRFEPAGTWNAMVTHRVHITDPGQIDNELMIWLKEAYKAA